MYLLCLIAKSKTSYYLLQLKAAVVLQYTATYVKNVT